MEPSVPRDAGEPLSRRSVTVGLAVVLTAALAAGVAPGRPPTARAATDWPVDILSMNTPSTRIDTVLADPYVSGISVRFGWAALEPSPGDYRWAKVDRALAQARAAGKVVMIRVMAGMFTPDWVKSQVRTLRFSDRYLYNPANYPDSVSMPVPWGARYLERWDRFVRAFGARYDGAAGLHSVAMSGGGFIGEMTLPTDVNKWLAAGYTDARLVGAWESIITSYRRAFPLSPITLGIAEPFGSLLPTNVVSPVVSYATAFDAKAAWIQSNALRSGALGNVGPYRTIIRSVNAITGVGYQMIGDAATTQSLRDAFTVAIQDGADYVEVYAGDVLATGNSTTLRYLASGGQA